MKIIKVKVTLEDLFEMIIREINKSNPVAAKSLVLDALKSLEEEKKESLASEAARKVYGDK